jgi:hypothetical protein
MSMRQQTPLDRARLARDTRSYRANARQSRAALHNLPGGGLNWGITEPARRLNPESSTKPCSFPGLRESDLEVLATDHENLTLKQAWQTGFMKLNGSAHVHLVTDFFHYSDLVRGEASKEKRRCAEYS